MKLAACLLALSTTLAAGSLPSFAASPIQDQPTTDKSGKPLASPPAKSEVTLAGKDVTILYNTPFIKGRKIFGGLVPYDKVWRTGANPATSFKTETDLKIGGTSVPAGSYTIYTLPSQTKWMLIINKETGQWGTKYDQSQDLARIPMHKASLSSSQEKMSITFEHTHGNSTQLHVRWDTTDVSVPVVAAK